MIDLASYAKRIDFLGPLALRLYLAPIFIAVGLHKFQNIDDIAAWFGGSLGMPMPTLMAYLAASAELFGGIALLVGAATRWFAVPLMVTMLVAAFAVHWGNGWFAIAPSNPSTSTAQVFAAVGFDSAQQSLENSEEIGKRLGAARSLLKKHGNYDWLTERGSFVVLNNGIEFSITYLIMLLSLFVTGGGRFVSVDHWVAHARR